MTSPSKISHKTTGILPSITQEHCFDFDRKKAITVQLLVESENTEMAMETRDFNRTVPESKERQNISSRQTYSESGVSKQVRSEVKTQNFAKIQDNFDGEKSPDFSERICNIDRSINWIKSELHLMQTQRLSLKQKFDELFMEIMDFKLRMEMERDEGVYLGNGHFCEADELQSISEGP